MFSGNKIQYAAMILCFLFAGVCILQLIYTNITLRGGLEVPQERFKEISEYENHSIDQRKSDFRRISFPLAITAFPFFGFIISTIAGFSLLDLLKKKEKKKITRDVMDTILTPEEKSVIKILEDSYEGLKQSDIVKKTNLSKVKVSRVIKRLETSKIISKYPYGMTNKIVLEKMPNGSSEKKTDKGNQS